MFAVYFVLLVLPLISAQVIGKGSCPIPHVQQDFNIHAYLGMWYEIARIPSSLYRGTCVTAEYKMEKDNSFSAEYTKFIDGKFSTKTAILRADDSGEPAKLEIKVAGGHPFHPNWVLYTDYSTYAVVYGCENHHDTHSQYAWIISRKPYLDTNTLYDAKRILVNEGIYGNIMTNTDQSCFIKTHGKN